LSVWLIFLLDCAMEQHYRVSHCLLVQGFHGFATQGRGIGCGK
jgi:hypothetical protein